MAIITVPIDDNVRVELNCRSHTFEARLAIALVEVMQYVVQEDECLGFAEVEDSKGNIVFQVHVGEECAYGVTMQQAYIQFWQQFVSFKKSRR